MNVTELAYQIDFKDFLDDRVEDGMFRIHRSIYHDAAVYEAEMDSIFERQWNFICHDSQMPQPGDYFARILGVNQCTPIAKRTARSKHSSTRVAIAAPY